MDKLITINLSYYNQIDFLKKHINIWNSFPCFIKKYFVFFVIDDCSKINALEILKDIDCQVSTKVPKSM